MKSKLPLLLLTLLFIGCRDKKPEQDKNFDRLSEMFDSLNLSNAEELRMDTERVIISRNANYFITKENTIRFDTTPHTRRTKTTFGHSGYQIISDTPDARIGGPRPSHVFIDTTTSYFPETTILIDRGDGSMRIFSGKNFDTCYCPESMGQIIYFRTLEGNTKPILFMEYPVDSTKPSWRGYVTKKNGKVIASGFYILPKPSPLPVDTPRIKDEVFKVYWSPSKQQFYYLLKDSFVEIEMVILKRSPGNNPNLLFNTAPGYGPYIPKPSPIPIDTPKVYRKFYRIEKDDPVLGRIAYIMDSLMADYGIEKPGTQIRDARKLFDAAWNYLFSRVDSVLIQKPKK